MRFAFRITTILFGDQNVASDSRILDDSAPAKNSKTIRESRKAIPIFETQIAKRFALVVKYAILLAILGAILLEISGRF